MTNNAVVHLVDDDEAVRQSLAFLLTTAGLDLVTLFRGWLPWTSPKYPVTEISSNRSATVREFGGDRPVALKVSTPRRACFVTSELTVWVAMHPRHRARSLNTSRTIFMHWADRNPYQRAPSSPGHIVLA